MCRRSRGSTTTKGALQSPQVSRRDQSSCFRGHTRTTPQRDGLSATLWVRGDSHDREGEGHEEGLSEEEYSEESRSQEDYEHTMYGTSRSASDQDPEYLVDRPLMSARLAKQVAAEAYNRCMQKQSPLPPGQVVSQAYEGNVDRSNMHEVNMDAEPEPWLLRKEIAQPQHRGQRRPASARTRSKGDASPGRPGQAGSPHRPMTARVQGQTILGVQDVPKVTSTVVYDPHDWGRIWANTGQTPIDR